MAIEVIGRLTLRNPAYVMPSLRKTLIQLLTELEFSGDARNKEESAKLLGHLIRSSNRLIKPYVSPILKSLMPKLRESNWRVASCVLGTLGELAVVGADEIGAHKDELVALIIDFLMDQSSLERREVDKKNKKIKIPNTHRPHMSVQMFRWGTRLRSRLSASSSQARRSSSTY